MIYFCCDQYRRTAVKNSTLNGIDFLEVIDRDALSDELRQRRLKVHFVNNLGSLELLTQDNFLIEGGERIRHIRVVGVNPGPNENILEIEVDQAGDFSTYTLRLIQSSLNLQPPAGFDPKLSAIDFSFKVECPGNFDCKVNRSCSSEPVAEPEINYLAKDYKSFRQLMLDRMAMLRPRWQERNPADPGMALVELLAYVGDYLSYQQDAVATEAYLGTARRRISVRRHALLVDYHVHNGCNARTWVQVQVRSDILKSAIGESSVLPKGTQLFTRIPGQKAVLPDDPQVLRQAQVVFETMHDVENLFSAHNQLNFYTWSDQRCCLPRGATQATLKGYLPDLKPGEVLILEELLSPVTGKPEDANRSQRHPIRLTQVVVTGPESEPLVDALNNQPITEITWAEEDALPFPFCISAITDADHGSKYIEDVSVARGNIVLADQGHTIAAELLGQVPSPALFHAPTPNPDSCQPARQEPIFPRFRPTLQYQPLTHAAPYNPAASAHAASQWETNQALPEITLQSALNADKATWYPKRNLLNSDANAREFVAEIETDGTVYLRFGDDLHGLRPEAQTEFTATYRIGNGVAGNIGAEMLTHIRTDIPVKLVRNPLPAAGGIEPESIEEVRQRAPYAFRTQERAVTPEDYARAAERHSQIQQAAATFRWTGSWHTVFLTIDRQNGLYVDNQFETEIRQSVEKYRMAGYDLEVDAPRFVPLEIEMRVCVQPDYFRSHVRSALLEIFSNRFLPDGRKGLFHPDNFTFGQTVFLSPIYAAAQAVPGVASVHIIKFQRQRMPDPKPLEEGKIVLGRLEIAQLDNDPNFPERGLFRLHIGGGK